MSEYRFYGDLARWWPLISPPSEYREDAALVSEILCARGSHVRDVLEIGSGGGNNALHLKEQFLLTLVDVAVDMLTVSRALNPECEHIEGDMRTIRLGRQFDGVLIHDAIDYMASEEDLARAITTAYEHCRPGGTVVLMPDDLADTFEEATFHDGNDSPDGRGVRYLEWSWDPDPSDSWILTEYVFVLREDTGTTQVVHETHRTGLHSRETWLRLLAGAGFAPEVILKPHAEDQRGREVFVGRRPTAATLHPLAEGQEPAAGGSAAGSSPASG